MKQKSTSRVDAEKAEGLDTVKSQVPDNKYQSEQQVQPTDEALNVESPKSGFVPKHSKVKGDSIKQKEIADVLTGSTDSAGMGINAAGRGVSGTAGGVLGANDGTPVANKSRSDTRIGKKLDRVATKLNFTPSEQVIVEFDESKPLADAADSDQGYNGTYRNEFARSQKISGAVPGELMFQRSVDFIMKDKLYFVEGQQVFQAGDSRTALNPTISRYNDGVDYTPHAVKYTSGNFLHHAFHFGLTDMGKVRYFFADVTDLTKADGYDPDLVNAASAHRLIKSNVAELDRQVMDSKAGDEKADIWTPLARAIDEPTAAAYLMSSMEAETGAYVYLAYSKATTNFSFQLNRAPKDGINETGPAIENCVGWRRTDDNSLDIASAYSGALSNCFDSDEYDLGDPTLMIAAYDSVNKYNNKADLLLQPRGWRMHLQTADNNMNVLKVPTEFANVYAGQEAFSTIEHEYDPILPICMTDKANLILVHNLNELCGFIPTTLGIGITATDIPSGYKYTREILIPKGAVKALGYENLYILYKKSTGDGLVSMTQAGVIKFDPDSTDGARTIDVIISTTNSVTGYTLVGTVAANFAYDAVIDIPSVKEATVTVSTFAWDDVKLFHKDAGPYSYVYSDLRNNYIVDVKHPLVEGIIQYINESIGGKFYKLLGDRHELLLPLVFSTCNMTLAQLVLCAATPWIVRVRINSMKDVIYYEDNVGAYPYSKLDSIKNVPVKNYVNFGFSDYDHPLEAKVMQPYLAIQWIMPEFFWKVDTNKYVLPWYMNEEEFDDQGDISYNHAMSFPSIRSGIRLSMLDMFYGMDERDIRLNLDRLTPAILDGKTISTIGAYKYGRTTDGQPFVVLTTALTNLDVLKCPRELGLCMDAPANVITVPTTALAAETSSAFRVRVYVNNNTLKTPNILAATGVNISRAANFVQKWFELRANAANSDTVIAGLVFGMNDEGAATFNPFGAIGTGAQLDSVPDIVSLQRSMWTRLQLLPFIISPFDGHATSGGGVRDIYDIAYMFGLAGFRASNYNESVYNREKEVVNQGYLFVEDPWVLESLIMRHGSGSTGLTVTKGYEVERA